MTTAAERTCHAFAIMNPKGGVGKTTTACNLAAALALDGHRTLLVDADPDGAATLAFGLQPEQIDAGLLNVFQGQVTPRDAILATAVDGLEILPNGLRTADESRLLLQLAADRTVLSRVVAAARAEYAWVVLDCPPLIGEMTLGALCSADGVLIPVQCGNFALKSMAKLFRLIRDVNRTDNPNLTIDGVLVTMYDARTASSPRVWRELRVSLGGMLMDTYIPHNARLNEATFLGSPSVVADPSASGSRAYRRLALEVVRRVSDARQAEG